MDKKLPITCPSCQSELNVQSLACESCDTTINGSYDLPLLLKLTQEEQEFILDFVRFSGSLKKMAKKLNLSYPTVRNMLDDLIDTIETRQQSDADETD
ncbi:MAG: DUF2089 domain-containing protein [Candidatus Marinimicrobia bacterium]|nr:DUF2089 domain-containing protein [Candidatus Neomarinimicrobiota bacterium]MCF7829860.1 DUF2089 domain-containing protein [Candidatus Neomarinimicrobiota bacterium]MCF7879177.1 DUF2089 domain-containing protein [Candidatus Neomarinimicrobiota bacterium]